MTTQTAAPLVGAPATAVQTATITTRRLLTCGIIAGPVFGAVVALQLPLREGFDLRRHPISLLSVGGLGWIQIANFVVAGLLCLGLAVGLRRALHPGRAGTWGPLLVGLYGVGLVVGGAFVADPGLGFPPGTPEGIPTQMSWHATVHAFAPAVAFNAVLLAGLVFVRRFAGRREWGWVAYTAVTVLAGAVLCYWPGVEGISVRLAVAVALTFAWLAALSRKVIVESARDRS